MKRLGLILIAALVWPTYVYGGRPSPPALRNPQDPVSYGADRSGVGDSTAAFQKAIQQGDLNIATPGLYKINGPVTVPSDRNIRCGPGTAATSTYAITPGNPKGNYTIFDWRGTNHGSLFGCQFRGENYNAPGKPAYDNTFQKAVLIESIGNAGTTGYVTIANNDFNGIGGFVAAVQIYGNDVNQPGPTRNLITYNKSEHCGYRAVEINSGTYNMVSYNTNVDCGDGVEQQDQLMQQGHNTFDHNTYAYPNGTGQGAGRGESIHWNSVSAGAACHGSGANGFCQGSEHVDYSTNTVSNSIITGLIPNGLVIGNSKTCSNTGLDTPFDVALDSSRRIYVANLGGNNILIFAAGANGNVPPVSAIAGANTKLNGPTALAFDSGGKLYVANEFGSVTVYAAGATGNVGPLRTIAGPHTTLSQPLGIALDSKQRVFVADGVDRIAVFNAGANGDVPPAAVVAGANTRLNGVNDVAVIAAPTPTARPTSTPQPLVARMSALMPDIPVPRLQVDEVDATVKVVLVGSGLGVFRSARDYWPWSRFNTGVGTIVPVSEIEQNENRIPFPETGERGAYGVIAAVVTPTPTPSRTPTSTPKTSPTPTRTKTATRTPTRTATRGPTPSPSRTVTRTPIRTPTKTPTRTPTRTATRKATPSPTRTPLPTMAPPLYVANAFSNNVTKYPPNANGNVAPAAILGGVSTGISNPQSLTLDKLGRAYVVNSGAAASITVYAAGAKGNTPPLAMIAGPTTRLDIPVGIAVDPAGRILVTNLSSVSTTYDSVLIFNAGANGNQAPAATISGGGNSVIPGVYVNNTCTQGCQVVCPPGSNPPATPVATTAGVPDAASFRDLPHPNQFAAGQEFRRRIEKRRNRP